MMQQARLQYAEAVLTWLVVLFLCLILSVTAGIVSAESIYDSDTFDSIPWYYFLDGCILVFFFLFLGLFLLCRQLLEKTGLTPGKPLKFVLLCVVVAGIFWLLNDEPPAELQYSWSDLSVAPKTCEQAYSILYTNFDTDREDMDTHFSGMEIEELMGHPMENEEEILALWEKTAPLRKVIDQLDSYDCIPDLSSVETAIDISLMPLYSALKVYRMYARLMTETGHSEVAARPLVKLYSVIRKILPYSRFVVNKAIWSGFAGRSVKIAADLAGHPSCSPETLKILKDSFTPLTRSEVSYKNAYISEYYFITKHTDQIDYYRAFAEIVSYSMCEPEPPEWNQYLFKLIGPLCFQRNRTANVITEQFNQMINATKTHPPDMSLARSIGHKPGIRNIGGQIFLFEFIADLTIYPENMSEIKTRSDLLALYLHERLGEKLEIKDYYSGKNYIPSEQPCRYFSVGPDGLPATNDDIQL